MSPHQATDSAISAWNEAPGTIREILSPEMRFRTPWGGGELADAVQNAHHWLIAHRRPDPSISGHLAALLDAYAEMPHATVGRVMELREIIGQNSHAVSRGRVPRPAHGSPGRSPPGGRPTLSGEAISTPRRCGKVQGGDMGTAVVTGARGIGYEVGRSLARSGVRVIFGVRNLELGERAAKTIRAEYGDADVTCELVDLADLKSVAAFGERMRSRHDRLEVLVNNAGVVMPLKRETTKDGFELHLGTNHLGHFALASALLPLLRAADAPRVVVVGSLAHRRADIDFDDLQAERSYRRIKAYGQSKLATLLFMRELQRRSDAGGWGLISTGAHPGFARTEAILRPDDSLAKRAFSKVASPLVPTAESAARPIVHAATSTEVVRAGYYGPSGPGEIAGQVGPAKLAARAQDPALAARMWDVSEALTAVRFAPD